MIGQSAVLVVTGLAVGLVIVRLAESALTRVVYGVTTTDALALVTASSLVAGCGDRRVRACGTAGDARESGGWAAGGITPALSQS